MIKEGKGWDTRYSCGIKYKNRIDMLSHFEMCG